MKKLLSFAFTIFLSSHMAFSQCNTTNATGCSCPTGGGTNCDLLPDMIVGKPPLLATGNYGVIEYSQTGNGSNNGLLRISVSTPNIGLGPLEVRSTPVYICGTDTFYGTAPSICPDGITYPKNLINQRVYHKNGNTMTYYDRPAGTMTYHPTHGHMHVDDWGKYSLRTATSNPDPLTWPIVATGAKLAFCLMDYGNCSYYSGHCVDSLGNTLLNNNFPNYGLGGGAFNCSPVVQGISSGYTDIYYQYLDGMWINLPAGLCNGNYYIVIQLDPYNYFLEANENNNVLAVPFTLTHQVAQPTLTTSANATICSGNSTTLTVSGATTYAWAPATGLSATTGSNISASPTTTMVYTVTGTNASGCTKTKSITVTVNAKPTLTLTPSTSLCTGQSTSLNVSGANTYTWTPATGLSATTGATVTSTPAGNITYTVTGTGSNGCTATSSVTLTVNPYPVVTLTPGSTICSGTSVTLTAGGATSYSWAPGTGLSATTGSNVNASPANTITYTVTGTTNGCSSTKTVTLTVITSPTLSLAPLFNICAGQTATLQVSGAVSYSWQPGTGLNVTTGASVNAIPASTTTYTVTGTAANGCTRTAQTTVNVIAMPTVTSSGNVAYCPGGSALLEASGADTYSWLPVTALDTAAGPSVTASPASTTTYTITGTTSGCSSTVNITVTVNAIPVVSFTGLNASYFDNDSDATLTGSPAGGIFTGPGISGNIFSPSAAGVGGAYVITYSFTDTNGCTGTNSQSVMVNQHAMNCGTPVQTAATNISPFAATVNWGPEVTALQFNVRYRKVGTVVYKYKTVSGLPITTSANLTTLLPNTDYECWVKCLCVAPTSFSNQVIFTTGGYPYSCIVPYGLQTTNITSSSANVSWDPAASGDSIELRYTNPTGSPAYKYKHSNVNTSVFNLINLTANTVYNWSVATYCNGKISAYSNTATFTTPPLDCGKPTQYQATNITPFSAQLNWGPDVTALQFKIRYRKIGTVTYNYLTISGAPSVVSAQLTHLIPNTDYECWVKCSCSTPTNYSNRITFTTSVYPYSCIVPFGLNATNVTTTSAMVSWDPAASGDSVQVKYTKSQGAPSYKYKNSGGSTSFMNLTNLSANTPYDWYVKTFCNGSSSGFSAVSTFTTQLLRFTDEAQRDETKVLAYPNPAHDLVHVVFNSTIETTGQLILRDITGRVVYKQDLEIIPGDNLVELNLQQFNKGIYTLSIEREGKIRIVKLSVN